MSLTLYIHPLASFCHKVMIALEEAQLAYRAVTVDLADPQSARQVFEHWPVGKIPLLHDAARGRYVADLDSLARIEGVEVVGGTMAGMAAE